jgi:hypothetical protein
MSLRILPRVLEVICSKKSLVCALLSLLILTILQALHHLIPLTQILPNKIEKE